MRQRVSAIVITRNNEQEIANCLQSIAWVDEIVVLDSYSSDGTEEICRGYGAKFFQAPFEGYSTQLNRCRKLASHEWILSVYADEVVSEQLRDQIRAVLETGETAADGYECPREQYLHSRLIKHSGFYPHPQLRFFRKSRGHFLYREPHQKVHVDGREGWLDGPIIHRSWVDNGQIFDNFIEYAKIEAAWAHAQGERVGFLNFLELPFEFLRRFLLRRGVLDGTLGLIMSAREVAYRYVKYTLMWELQNQDRLKDERAQRQR